MYRNILVPLDGSAFAEVAIPTAAALANAMDASLTLVHVREAEAPDYRAGEAALAAQRTMFLARAATETETSYRIKASTLLLEGNPIDEMCASAAERDKALVVMTTHGRTGWSRVWLGSVADGVMRHATTPVLMLSIREAPHNTAAGWPLPFRTIVVPLDGTSFAEEVVPHAAAIAEASRARLILLHVVTPVAPPAPEIPTSYVPPAELITELTESIAQRSRDYTAGISAMLRAAHPRLELSDEVVVADSVARAIIETAKRRQADCIALATHGRGLSRLVVASVADKVVRAGPGAVLLMRPAHD
ncbi:MAG TPA: universal stress protein [Gemmatimonadaceae bacterium]